MKVERLGEDRILIQIYGNGEEHVISDNLAEELASNLNLIKFCGPPNNTVEDRQAGECASCKYQYTHRLCGLTRDDCNYTPAT